MGKFNPEMAKYNREYAECGHFDIENLTPEETNSFYFLWFCPTCCMRYYKGVEYDPDEWQEHLKEAENLVG